jgi:hypothetical protein
MALCIFGWRTFLAFSSLPSVKAFGPHRYPQQREMPFLGYTSTTLEAEVGICRLKRRFRG